MAQSAVRKVSEEELLVELLVELDTFVEWGRIY